MTKDEAKELLAHVMISYIPQDQYGDFEDTEPYDQAFDMAIEALSAEQVTSELDLISRQDAVALVNRAIRNTDNKEIQEYLFDGLRKEMWALPSAEPKTGDNTNANEIYNYLKEQIGDTVDDMKEFDAWFERVVWHVKECNRLTAEPKTGKWTEVEVLPEVYDIEGVKSWGSKMQCDQCGFRFTAIEGHITQYNYCPYCGARMI